MSLTGSLANFFLHQIKSRINQLIFHPLMREYEIKQTLC